MFFNNWSLYPLCLFLLTAITACLWIYDKTYTSRSVLFIFLPLVLVTNIYVCITVVSPILFTINYICAILIVILAISMGIDLADQRRRRLMALEGHWCYYRYLLSGDYNYGPIKIDVIYLYPSPKIYGENKHGHYFYTDGSVRTLLKQFKLKK